MSIDSIEKPVGGTELKGPGAHLRFARETKRLSLFDVSKQLRLSVQRVTDIENDDYRRFGALTYVRGYLRSYARQVGLMEEDILAEFDRQNLSGTVPQSVKPQLLAKKQPFNPSPSRQHSRRWMVYLAFLVIILLVATIWNKRIKHLAQNLVIPQEQIQTQSPLTQQAGDDPQNAGQVNQTAPSNPAVIQQQLPLQTLPGKHERDQANTVSRDDTSSQQTTDKKHRRQQQFD